MELADAVAPQIADNLVLCRAHFVSLSELIPRRAKSWHSVIIGAIIELVFRNRIAGSEDLTSKSWPIVITVQTVQTLSIITACIPYLKPFFASLESGMIRADDSRRLASRSIWSDGYRRTPVPNKGSSSTMLRSLGSRKFYTWTDVLLQGGIANYADSTDVHRHNTRGSEGESQTSQSRIIVPTAVWPPTPPPDCSRSLSQTPIEDPEEKMERFKLEAKRAYDTLIQMGGRPTRPIRCNLNWKTVLFGEEKFSHQWDCELVSLMI